MKPEKLTLLNIGPFLGRHVVDFADLGDIFLVFGKTGAGKTTIFDAISYAFYGEVPGARKGLSAQMRSQFAADGEQCAVELEFTLARSRWRIRRTLAGERPGKKTDKAQKIPEESSLEAQEGGTWVNRSSANKSETDAAIRDLIGLSAEEFSRIVLLPQGEFAQFLRQKTTERKQVLAKLFPIDDHLAVMERVKAKTREAQASLAATESAIAALRAAFDPDAAETERVSLAERSAALRAAQESARGELKRQSAALELARAHERRLEERHAHARTLAELETGREQIGTITATLAAARKAEPLALAMGQIAGRRESHDAACAELELARSELAEAERRIAELAAEAPAVAQCERDKAAALIQRERLEIALDIAHELEEAEAGLAAASAERKAAALELKTILAASLEAEEAMERLAPVIAELEVRSSEKEAASLALEKAKRLKNIAEEHERERLSLTAHAASAEQAREERERTEGDLAIARAELEALTGEAERQREAGQAAALAERLEPGKPCPVCGSTAHPLPARAPAVESFTLSERIDAARRTLERLETERRNKADEWAKRVERRSNAEKTLEQTVGRYCLEAFGEAACVPEGGIPSPEAAIAALSEAASRMETANNRSVEAQRAMNDHRAQGAKRDTAAKRAETVKARLSALDSDIASRKSGIKIRTERYNEAFAADSTGFRSGEGIPDQNGAVAVPAPAGAEDALESCKASILEYDAKIETYRRETAAYGRKAAALGARVETLEASIASLAAELDLSGREFAAACAAAGFADGNAARAAVRSEGEIVALESRVELWNRSMTETASVLARLNAELASWSGTSVPEAEKAVEDLERAIVEREEETEDVTRKRSALNERETRWAALEAERLTRSSEALRYDRLNRDLSGNNPQKVPFDAWILGMYLEEIAAYANARLERMSDGRYRIRVNDSYRTGNAMAGLDLDIVDAWTGKTRPAGTLSGGETFMASISLALGLADSIQSRSGGIQLDAVFIDEGFGSLDEASLERAITILDEIRGSRTVGLISHVAELRSRIPNRIEIVKTATGSSVLKETYP